MNLAGASCYHGPAMARTAGIILIGNELLSGKVADANAVYLCRELRALGVDVRRIVVIPDEIEKIAHEVAEFSRSFDVVFTSGGVGPTHDDVTIEGIARAFGVPVVRDPAMVAALEGFYGGSLNPARIRMAEIPQGAEPMTADGLVFPAVIMKNVHVLPGVPELFRRKFEGLKERFRDVPFYLASVYVSVGEGILAEHLNAVLERHPELLLGSYPEFSNPEYKVKVTLESKDQRYMERALDDLLGRLPPSSLVRVQR
jgi:FAD synthetase